MSELTSPPPPYEPSQQEFDQKTSLALEASASDIRQTPDSPGEDVWEDYDEEAFEIAFQAAQAARQRQSEAESLTAGPSDATSLTQSSRRWSVEKVDHPITPTVQPLRIHKKAPSSSYRAKEQPSWYAEAHLGGSSSFQPLSSPSSLYEERHSSHATPSQHQFIPEHDEDNVTAPPPFEHQGPDLDGPPFEEVVLAYHASAPPSPLSSPSASGVVASFAFTITAITPA